LILDSNLSLSNAITFFRNLNTLRNISLNIQMKRYVQAISATLLLHPFGRGTPPEGMKE
jgi:hypothetical protein